MFSSPEGEYRRRDCEGESWPEPPFYYDREVHPRRRPTVQENDGTYLVFYIGVLVLLFAACVVAIAVFHFPTFIIVILIVAFLVVVAVVTIVVGMLTQRERVLRRFRRHGYFPRHSDVYTVESRFAPRPVLPPPYAVSGFMIPRPLVSYSSTVAPGVVPPQYEALFTQPPPPAPQLPPIADNEAPPPYTTLGRPSSIRRGLSTVSPPPSYPTEGEANEEEPLEHIVEIDEEIVVEQPIMIVVEPLRRVEHVVAVIDCSKEIPTTTFRMPSQGSLC